MSNGTAADLGRTASGSGWSRRPGSAVLAALVAETLTSVYYHATGRMEGISGISEVNQVVFGRVVRLAHYAVAGAVYGLCVNPMIIAQLARNIGFI